MPGVGDGTVEVADGCTAVGDGCTAVGDGCTGVGDGWAVGEAAGVDDGCGDAGISSVGCGCGGGGGGHAIPHPEAVEYITSRDTIASTNMAVPSAAATRAQGTGDVALRGVPARYCVSVGRANACG
jgi:hypothetical protein